jgi:rare lipoprotein A
MSQLNQVLTGIHPFAISLLASVLLSACATGSQRQAPPPPVLTGKVDPKPDARSPGASTPQVPQAGGRYYDQDGPPLEVPDDLASRPDALPSVEPFHSFANRPYTVFGQQYQPITEFQAFTQKGIASWYGRMFHGRKTSNGEVYDMLAMTAAHPTLPLPSYARVTNVANGKQVIVRVNDRGPFLHGRIIDLSYAAAFRLGYADRGSAEVEVEWLQPNQIAALQLQSSGAVQTNSLSVTPLSPAPAVTPAPAVAVAPQLPPAAVVNLPPRPSEIIPPRAVNAAAAVAPAASKVSAGPGYYVQLGAFNQAANAQASLSQWRSLLAGLGSTQIHEQDQLFKLQVGPFSDKARADRSLTQWRQRSANSQDPAAQLLPQGFIVRR